jgi:hypothetical protein
MARDSIFTRFVRRGEGVRPILGQVYRLSGAQCRVWYQVTAGIYPTQAYLARIGLAITDRCEFCLGERETTGHFTNRCSAFHDTRTKSHNEAWEETLAAISPLLPKTTKLYSGLPLRKTPLQYTAVEDQGLTGPRSKSRKWTSEQVGNLCPDTVAVDKEKRRICILEYSRPSDTRPEALHEAAHRKTDKYQVLLAALRHYSDKGWTVTLLPLPVGVRGSLLLQHWVPALEALEIPNNQIQKILQQAAAASAKALHTLHLCRHKRRRIPETASSRYKRREYAKEVWGPALPSI